MKYHISSHYLNNKEISHHQRAGMFYDLVRIVVHGKLSQQRGSKVAVCVTGNTHVFWELVFDIGECFWHQLLEKYHIWLLPVTKQNIDYIKQTHPCNKRDSFIGSQIS